MKTLFLVSFFLFFNSCVPSIFATARPKVLPPRVSYFTPEGKTLNKGEIELSLSTANGSINNPNNNFSSFYFHAGYGLGKQLNLYLKLERMTLRNNAFIPGGIYSWTEYHPPSEGSFWGNTVAVDSTFQLPGEDITYLSFGVKQELFKKTNLNKNIPRYIRFLFPKNVYLSCFLPISITNKSYDLKVYRDFHDSKASWRDVVDARKTSMTVDPAVMGSVIWRFFQIDMSYQWITKLQLLAITNQMEIRNLGIGISTNTAKWILRLQFSNIAYVHYFKLRYYDNQHSYARSLRNTAHSSIGLTIYL